MQAAKKDFFISDLLSMRKKIQDALNIIEKENSIEYSFANEAIRKIEIDLRRAKKICAQHL